MPCRSLPSYIAAKERIVKRISLRDLASHNYKKVVVDGTALLYFILSKLDWTYNGESELFYTRVTQFCNTFKELGLNMLVLIDGCVSHDNFAAGLKRSTEKIHRFEALLSNLDASKTRGPAPNLFPLAMPVMIQALQDSNIPIRVCESEATRYVYGTAASAHCLQIGYDSNYLLMKTPGYIHCDSLQFTSNDIKANVVVASTLAKELGMPVDRLPLISAICGNEAVAEWTFSNMHRQLLPVADWDDRMAVIDAVVQWLAQFPETVSNEEIKKAAITLNLTALPEDKASQVPEIIFPEESSEYTPYHQFFAASDVEKEAIIIDSFTKNDEIFTPLQLTKEFTRPQTFYQEVTGKEKSAFNEAFFSGKLNLQTLSLLINGIFWHKPAFENFQKEASCLAGLTARQVAYAILFGNGDGVEPKNWKPLREAYRVNDSYELVEVDPIWSVDGSSVPDLTKLMELSEDERFNLLCKFIGFTSDDIEAVKKAPANSLFLAVCLRYFAKEIDVSRPQIVGLIEHIISPRQTRSRSERIIASPDLYHMSSQWQSVILSLAQLNELMGKVLNDTESKLHFMYNGVAFFASVNDAEVGRALTDRYSEYFAGEPSEVYAEKLASATATEEGFVSAKKSRINLPSEVLVQQFASIKNMLEVTLVNNKDELMAVETKVESNQRFVSLTEQKQKAKNSERPEMKLGSRFGKFNK